MITAPVDAGSWLSHRDDVYDKIWQYLAEIHVLIETISILASYVVGQLATYVKLLILYPTMIRIYVGYY